MLFECLFPYTSLFILYSCSCCSLCSLNESDSFESTLNFYTPIRCLPLAADNRVRQIHPRTK